MVSIHLSSHVETPCQELQKIREATQPNSNDLLFVPFTYRKYWLEDQSIELVAIYLLYNGELHYGVAERNQIIDSWANATEVEVSDIFDWLLERCIPLFNSQDVLPLQTVQIPKPWGQEIWYTGVEKRGVACFGTDDSQIPIPYLLEVMPELLGKAQGHSLVLLKILDPLPEEVFGDLYFEIHREKQEVYVVTNIDRTAWPDGTGNMRMGFNPEKINELNDDANFRKQFLHKVEAYREIRFRIDRMLDERRIQAGYELNAEVPVKLLKQWLAELPEGLQDEELRLRHAMESYFGSLPLKNGDVVKVPLNVPHSLQHGVRTIEFQTPVYERRIIAFCQKVLTQSEWDTEQGVEEMEIAHPALPELKELSNQDGIHVEQVVEFSDFEVHRITLAANSSYQAASDVYRLIIVIEGNILVGTQRLSKEQAALIPAELEAIQVQSVDEHPAVFLVAIPK